MHIFIHLLEGQLNMYVDELPLTHGVTHTYIFTVIHVFMHLIYILSRRPSKLVYTCSYIEPYVHTCEYGRACVREYTFHICRTRVVHGGACAYA